MSIFSKAWKSIKKFVKKNKEKINDIAYYLYLKLRKNYPFDPNLVVKIPCGALGSVKGKNKATILYQKSKVGKDNPAAQYTHSFLYVGSGDHKIVEADIYFSFNRLERYRGKQVVFYYFKNMTVEEMQELKDRIYYLVSLKLRYDAEGYAHFIDDFIAKKAPFLKDIDLLDDSKKHLFCSEANATIYQGDKNNGYEKVRKWKIIKKVSNEDDPSEVCPADIAYFLEIAHKAYPNVVGKIVLEPKDK